MGRVGILVTLGVGLAIIVEVCGVLDGVTVGVRVGVLDGVAVGVRVGVDKAHAMVGALTTLL